MVLTLRGYCRFGMMAGHVAAINGVDIVRLMLRF